MRETITPPVATSLAAREISLSENMSLFGRDAN
jgi:hypothetical protein